MENIYVPCLGGLGVAIPPGYPVGWYTQEISSDNTKFHWATKTATLQVLNCSSAISDYTLKFKALSTTSTESQAVTISVNDTNIGTINLDPASHEYEITVPAGVIQPDSLVSIKLDHNSTFMPANDPRDLAVAYTWVSITPSVSQSKTTTSERHKDSAALDGDGRLSLIPKRQDMMPAFSATHHI